VHYRLELPESGGARVVRDFVAGWVQHPALRDIVESEGGGWPEGSLSEQVRALHQFSSRWDFRGGAERLEFSAGDQQRDEARIVRAAEQLGLTAAAPPATTDYDHALVLGGTALASIYRVRRLFDIRQRTAEIRNPAVLTALREIGDGELDLVRRRDDLAALVDGVHTEFDVMTNAVAHFGHATPEVTRTPDANPHLASARAEVGDTLVLAAPSADQSRRANTRDNYDVYSEQIGRADAVLVVTSSIYLPYQFFIALQALGWDSPRTIEAVGFPPEWMQGVLTGVANILQETRSALYGAMKTLEMLDGAST
jgi:hypothetical protein